MYKLTHQILIDLGFTFNYLDHQYEKGTMVVILKDVNSEVYVPQMLERTVNTMQELQHVWFETYGTYLPHRIKVNDYQDLVNKAKL